MSALEIDVSPFSDEELGRDFAPEEGAYRRGYTHGYTEAMDDMLHVMHRLGYSRPKEAWNILAEFHDEKLTAWRAKPNSAWIDPPVIGPSLPPHWSALRLAVFERDGWQCVWCGSPNDLQCDHILEVRRGGLPDMENLRTLCATCHRSRT